MWFFFFNSNEDEDVPNCILDDIGVLSQKVTNFFYSSSMEHVDWGNLIWLGEVSLAKILVLWKLLYGHLLVDWRLIKRVVLCSLCSLCGIYVESFFHLFFNYSIVIQLWEGRKFFRICNFFLWIFFVQFMKSPCSHLFKVIKSDYHYCCYLDDLEDEKS